MCQVLCVSAFGRYFPCPRARQNTTGICQKLRQPLRHGDYVENSKLCLLPAAAQGAGAASVFAFPRSCHSSLTFGTFVAVGFLNAGSDRHPKELGDITGVG